ncbi:hypothetical protein ABMA27_001243 [Loxostege sticticalis]|uniref:Regulatory protein zeste n=1 Tax=Loxostege sticticalis TaxID=481309 RepID=A0ABR3HXS6_LOXSC
MESTRRVTTLRQLEILVEFLREHPDLALGRLRTKEARATSSRLWGEITESLNTEGPARSSKEWTKVWNDLKCKVRGKLVAINASQHGAGGGPNTGVTLSTLEESMAQILGRDVGPAQNVAQDHFVNNEEKTDAGEKAAEFHECEGFIFSIIEKDTSGDGLDVLENSEQRTSPETLSDTPLPTETVSENSEQGTLIGTHSDTTLPTEKPKSVRTKNSILQHLTSTDDFCELVQLKKKKAEVEIEIMKEKLDIARREKYKLDLELVKMERDLGIAQPSSFTAPYSPIWRR